jgi:hypothetical protein
MQITTPSPLSAFSYQGFPMYYEGSSQNELYPYESQAWGQPASYSMASSDYWMPVLSNVYYKFKDETRSLIDPHTALGDRKRKTDDKNIEYRFEHQDKMAYRCDICGKIYKYSTHWKKHRWVHEPGWELTKHMKLSKRQQIEVLQAASALTELMNS